MNFRELYAYTRRILHGNYGRAFAASSFYGTIWLVLKLAPCILAAVLIANGTLTMRMLLSGSPMLWVLFSVLWAVLRFCIMLPLRCGACAWFTELVGLNRSRCRRTFFRTTGAYLRALWYFLRVEAMRFTAMLPFVLGVLGAGMAFQRSIGMADAGLPLFIAAQCLCVAAAGLVYYLRFCVGIAAVPFLYLEQPHGSPFAAVRHSRRMLHGRHALLILLVLGHLPAALPVVTIPFLLPHLLTSCTLFLQIRMREWEQLEKEEGHANTILSHGTKRALQAGNVSAAGLRSVTPPALQAQAYRRRHDTQRSAHPQH